MYFPVYIQIILTVVLAFLDALHDSSRIKKGETIDHLPEMIIRGIILMIITGFDPYMLMLCSAIFWILFELALNKMRGLDWLYVGKTALQDKFVRRIFGNNNPGLPFLIIKLIVLGALIYFRDEIYQIISFTLQYLSHVLE